MFGRNRKKQMLQRKMLREVMILVAEAGQQVRGLPVQAEVDVRLMRAVEILSLAHFLAAPSLQEMVAVHKVREWAKGGRKLAEEKIISDQMDSIFAEVDKDFTAEELRESADTIEQVLQARERVDPNDPNLTDLRETVALLRHRADAKDES